MRSLTSAAIDSLSSFTNPHPRSVHDRPNEQRGNIGNVRCADPQARTEQRIDELTLAGKVGGAETRLDQIDQRVLARRGRPELVVVRLDARQLEDLKRRHRARVVFVPLWRLEAVLLGWQRVTAGLRGLCLSDLLACGDRGELVH